MERLPTTVLEEGATFWMRANADRFALVVDAGDYYAALASSLRKARRQVVILAWDFDTRAPLLIDPKTHTRVTLAEILIECLEANPELRIHVLCWDFAMVYAKDREKNPVAEFPAHVVDRIRIAFDGIHPTWGSHHQKVVILDGVTAYVGGLDIAMGRWDTREHLAVDERRRDARGKDHIPYHDAMCLVDGSAARALHALARTRYLRFSGEELPLPKAEDDPRLRPDAWPDGVSPIARDVPVAFARTEPGFLGHPRVTEIQSLFLRMIAGARRSIYMETQYFSCDILADALARRLAEKDGPEIVLIVPRRYGGFIERNAVGARQAQLIAKLKRRDPHGRFLALSPMASRAKGQHIHVHAKVVVVDDAFFTLGSANLNARSLGYDTEVNLVIDAPAASSDGRMRVDLSEAIVGVRDDLLTEHLGLRAEPGAWQAALVAEGGSMVKAIVRSQNRDRTLVAATDKVSWIGRLLARGIALVDPDRPLPYDELADSLMEASREAPRRGRGPVGLLTLLVLALTLLVLWRTTPLGAWLEPEKLALLGESLWNSPLGPVAATGAVFLLTTFLVPVNLLTLAFAITLPPWPAVVTTFTGSLLSAMATYAVGRRMGAGATERMLGARFKKLDLARRLSHTGLFAVVLVRVIPIAPFTVMNIACGAFRIPFVNYALGTAIALVPGKLAVVFFASSLKDWARHPKEILSNPWAWLAFAGCALGIVGLFLFKRTDAWKKATRQPVTPEAANSTSAKSGV